MTPGAWKVRIFFGSAGANVKLRLDNSGPANTIIGLEAKAA